MNDASPTLQKHIDKKEGTIKKSLKHQLAVAFPEETYRKNEIRKMYSSSQQESNISQISDRKESTDANAAAKI